MERGSFDSVVVISPFFWNFRDDMWLTTQHIAREFSALVPTLFVEPAPQWNPWSEQFRAHRLISACSGRRTKAAGSNLTVFHRRGLPGGRVPTIRDFDLARNARALRQVVEDNGMRRPLVWHSFPYWSRQLEDALGSELLAYHCLDYSPREEELDLIERAQAVYCVSEALVHKHRTVNPHTYLLPNGVDLTLFDPARAAVLPRPSDLPASGRALGFVGSINCHLDIELLEAVAKARPRDHVVMIGRVLTNETAPRGEHAEALTRLRRMANVRILGFKPTADLPRYLHAFDVCLIPFLQNQFNYDCDPLKFYEYMAMAKPVVATPVRVAERYADVCFLAKTRHEYLAAIEAAIVESSYPDRVEARLALARAHSWPTLLQNALGTLATVHGKAAIAMGPARQSAARTAKGRR